jgi:hypothetical protein
MNRWRDVGAVRRSALRAREAIGGVPGLASLLSGVTLFWLVGAAIPVRGLGATVPRLAVVLLVGLVYFARMGCLTALRGDLQRLRAGLASAATWGQPLSVGQRRLLRLAGWVLRVRMPSAAHPWPGEGQGVAPSGGSRTGVRARLRGPNAPHDRCPALRTIARRPAPVGPTLAAGILIGATVTALLTQATGQDSIQSGPVAQATATPAGASSLPPLAPVYTAYAVDEAQLTQRAFLREKSGGRLGGSLQLWRLSPGAPSARPYAIVPLGGSRRGRLVRFSFHFWDGAPDSFSGTIQGALIVGVENGANVAQDHRTTFCATARVDRVMC